MATSLLTVRTGLLSLTSAVVIIDALSLTGKCNNFIHDEHVALFHGNRRRKFLALPPENTPRARSFPFHPSLAAASDYSVGLGGDEDAEEIDLESLMEMDIVTYYPRPDSIVGENTTPTPTPALELGAVQEDGSLAPLCAWTMESAFANKNNDVDGSEDAAGGSVELLVNEDLSTFGPEDVIIKELLDESVIGYGSRQVGGGKGPGNPHGEESEMLYYVDKGLIEAKRVNIVIRPELEILW